MRLLGTGLAVVGMLLIRFYALALEEVPERFATDIVVLTVPAVVLLMISLVTRSKFPVHAALVLLLLGSVFPRSSFPGMNLAAATMLSAISAVLVSRGNARRAAIQGALFLALWLILSIPARHEEPVGLQAGSTVSPLAQRGSVLVFPIALVTLGTMAHKREQQRIQEQARSSRLELAIQNLTRANVGFQQYAKDVTERSRNEERERITRDIHDSIGYMITNLTVLLDAAGSFVDEDTERARSLIRQARTQAGTGHAEIRRALHALRHLEHAEAYGLKNVLRIADSFHEATGVEVSVNIVNVRKTYGAVIDATLYRLVQEALANAFRHGKAQHVDIRLIETGGEVIVTVQDDGIGATEIKEGIGFLGMRERLSQVGGNVAYDNLPNGFKLMVHIPVPRQKATEQAETSAEQEVLEPWST